MIIVRITGGVGNQLFQYAFGYALQKRLNKQVLFDVSYYKTAGKNGTTKRSLELEAFKLNGFDKITESGIKNDLYSKSLRLVKRIFLPYYKQYYIQELQSNLRFDSNIFKLSNNAYLDGYWQSYKYFECVVKEINEQIVLKEGLSTAAMKVCKLINEAPNTISIHVRRGDYLTDYSHIFCILENDYYARGINYIKKKIKADKVTMFVFSDDPAWCRENFNYADKTIFVDNKDMQPYEDMILMSQCCNNIIANSSYSWWAAWLNNNPQKVVVGPKNWFIDSKLNHTYINDVLPVTWARL